MNVKKLNLGLYAKCEFLSFFFKKNFFVVEVHFNGDADSAIDVPRPEEDRTTAVSKKKDLQEQLKVCCC